MKPIDLRRFEAAFDAAAAAFGDNPLSALASMDDAMVAELEASLDLDKPEKTEDELFIKAVLEYSDAKLKRDALLADPPPDSDDLLRKLGPLEAKMSEAGAAFVAHFRALNERRRREREWEWRIAQADNSIMDAPPPPREWLVPNWIPANSIGTFSGRGGLGKSNMLLMLEYRLAVGRGEWMQDSHGLPPHEWHPDRPRVNPDLEPCHVVYASWEDDLTTINARLLNAPQYRYGEHGHPEDGERSMQRLKDDTGGRLHYLNLLGMGAIWAPGGGGKYHIGVAGEQTPVGARLRAYCEKVGARLLVIDSRAAAFGSNENERWAVRAFMGSWAAWASENKCTVLILSHPPKDGSASDSGSGDWEAASRFAIALGLDEREEGDYDAKTTAVRTKLELTKANYATRQVQPMLVENRAWWSVTGKWDAPGLAPVEPALATKKPSPPKRKAASQPRVRRDVDGLC